MGNNITYFIFLKWVTLIIESGSLIWAEYEGIEMKFYLGFDKILRSDLTDLVGYIAL